MGRVFLGFLLIAFLPNLTVAQLRMSGDIGKIDEKKLDEISGCAISSQNRKIMWVHNDGEVDFIYAIRSTGEVVARVRLPVAVKDLEDISIGPGPGSTNDYIYVGDIGDNDLKRDSIQILCFPEPLLANEDSEINVPYMELYSLKYPDGKHNAETLLIDPVQRTILIMTKDGSRTQIYGVETDFTGRPIKTKMRLLGQLDLENISGGDVSRDGSQVIVRREKQGWLWSRKTGQALSTAMMKAGKEVDVRRKIQGANGESICFSPGGKFYCTISEGKNETICLFRIEQIE